MTSVAVALQLADEQRLLADAPRHGHRVVLRATSAEELAAAIPASGAELVLVAAAAPYLSSRAVAACDAQGLRLVVVAGSAHERRFATSLGVVDAVDGPFDWGMLTGVPAAPTPSSSPSPGPIPVPIAVEVDEETSVRFVRPPGSTVRRPSARPPTIPHLPTPPTRGSIVAVWGPEGAPGRTSIAIALAAELAADLASGPANGPTNGPAAESARRAAPEGAPADPAVVALADADTRAAAIAPALGLLDEAPGFAAACRLAGAGALDRQQFDRIAQSARAGRGELRVLTGIGRASRWPELTTDRIAGVLTAARDWAQVTVVDVASSFELDEELMTDLHAPRRNAATLEVLRSADRIVAVGAADPVGLSRFLRAHGELVDLVGPERITTVINKLRPGAIGMDAASQVRQTLARFGGIDDPVLVPWDLAAFDAALLAGRPLLEVAPRSAARAAIRALAAGMARLPVPA